MRVSKRTKNFGAMKKWVCAKFEDGVVWKSYDANSEYEAKALIMKTRRHNLDAMEMNGQLVVWGNTRNKIYG